MFELRTDFGIFSNFKDMARYMEEEGIEKATVGMYYIFDKMAPDAEYTLEEIKGYIAEGRLD